MSSEILNVTGKVRRPLSLTYQQFEAINRRWQVEDVSLIVKNRPGSTVRLQAVLDLADAHPDAAFLGLHGSRDDFHASIPLAAVREKALIIYRIDGKPLEVSAGGPLRFLIPDHAACGLHEIDECANVKFLDQLELTVGKGHDNRPQDEDAHARLHDSQSS